MFSGSDPCEANATLARAASSTQGAWIPQRAAHAGTSSCVHVCSCTHASYGKASLSA